MLIKVELMREFLNGCRGGVGLLVYFGKNKTSLKTVRVFERKLRKKYD